MRILLFCCLAVQAVAVTLDSFPDQQYKVMAGESLDIYGQINNDQTFSLTGQAHIYVSALPPSFTVEYETITVSPQAVEPHLLFTINVPKEAPAGNYATGFFFVLLEGNGSEFATNDGYEGFTVTASEIPEPSSFLLTLPFLLLLGRRMFAGRLSR